MTKSRELVLVVDRGVPYAQLIARRVREAGVYSEIIPVSTPVPEIQARGASAIVLAGGPMADSYIELGIPIFGIGDGFEEITPGLAAVLRGEDIDTDHGQQSLTQFLYGVAGLSAQWNASVFVEEAIAAIRAQVGDAQVLCGLSGGVDSAVCAALVQRAVGDQLSCVFVDTGLMRKGEVESVERDFVAATGAHLIVTRQADVFLDKLAGVTDPEAKRKAIGHQFIRTFEDEARKLAGEKGIKFLVQGTIYPDVVESGSPTGGTIKSHHNVGGLPEDLDFELVEPLRFLFKDEVRAAGEELGLPSSMVWRHPFPGPGLAVRVVGEVTKDRLDILREADAIANEELVAAGFGRTIWQFPVVLLADVRSVGMKDDARTYGTPVVLRPITSLDATTAEWGRLPYDLVEKISTRITSEVPQINRVVLDVTSKPPATIEWE